MRKAATVDIKQPQPIARNPAIKHKIKSNSPKLNFIPFINPL